MNFDVHFFLMLFVPVKKSRRLIIEGENNTATTYTADESSAAPSTQASSSELAASMSLNQLPPRLLTTMLSMTSKPSLVVSLDISKNYIGSAYTVLPPAVELPYEGSVPRSVRINLGASLKRVYRPSVVDGVAKSRNLSNDRVFVKYLNELVPTVNGLLGEGSGESSGESSGDSSGDGLDDVLNARLAELTSEFSGDVFQHDLFPPVALKEEQFSNLNGPFFVVGWPGVKDVESMGVKRAIMSMVGVLTDNASKCSGSGQFMYTKVDEIYSTLDVYGDDMMPMAAARRNKFNNKKGKRGEKFSMEDSLAAKVILERFLEGDWADGIELIE
jgi:hypothetical protein